MRILILDDDRLYGNILSHQISELTNRQWICHNIEDNKNISDLLSRVDMILVDKNLDGCAYDSKTIIDRIMVEYPEMKIVMISGASPVDKIDSVPFILKDERIAINVTNIVN